MTFGAVTLGKTRGRNESPSMAASEGKSAKASKDGARSMDRMGVWIVWLPVMLGPATQNGTRMSNS